MRYQKRHYEDVARLLGETANENGHDTLRTVNKVVKEFDRLFASDNSRFDSDRFMSAYKRTANLPEDYNV